MQYSGTLPVFERRFHYSKKVLTNTNNFEIMAGTKPESVNKPSSCLKQSENEEIFSMLGRRCTTLATSVAQLYIAPPEARNRWKKLVTGVICFVKDNAKRSYFLRMYSLVTRGLEWEQELYNQFKYTASRPHFHIFAADAYNAGLNFAKVDEARNFINEIDKKLHEKLQRRQERRKENSSRHNKLPPPPPAVGGNVEIGKRNSLQSHESTGNVPHSPSQTSLSSMDGSSSSINRRKSKERKESKSGTGSNNKKGGKRRITKDDIGKPENFQHVGHIGWDPQGGFDVNNVDMDGSWKKLLDLVGITEDQMHEKKTMDFIYDFVEKRGGIENVTREIEKEREGGPAAPAPPAPSRGQSRGPPPPPPPSRGAPPPPPARVGGAPPPPPPSRGGIPPPPPPSRGALPPPPPMGRAPPPPPSGVPPPPAPPPPPPAGGVPPPPPPMLRGGPLPSAPRVGGSGSGRGALLDQIKGGASLKKVTPSERRQSSSDGRGDLLSEIRTGKQLKKVSEEDGQPKNAKPPVGGGGGGILGALQLALEQREKAIHSSESESDSASEFEDDDDEWMD